VSGGHVVDLHLNAGQWGAGALLASLLCIPLARHRVESDGYWQTFTLIGWGFVAVLVGIVVRGLLDGGIRLHG
jgi:hypothetical protein